MNYINQIRNIINSKIEVEFIIDKKRKLGMADYSYIIGKRITEEIMERWGK